MSDVVPRIGDILSRESDVVPRMGDILSREYIKVNIQTSNESNGSILICELIVYSNQRHLCLMKLFIYGRGIKAAT